MSIGGVVLQFRADAEKARKDIGKLTKTLDGVDDSARRGSKTLANIARAGLAGIAVAGVAAAGALYSFAKAAAADWQEAEKLSRTLKAVPGVTDAMVAANARWIDSMEIATGFSDSEFRNSIGRLALATGDLAEAQTLAALAADVAAGRNISLASASQLLEKAAAGNTMQLKRQMPWLDLNRDGTISMAEAVKGLTDAYGGAAAAAADNNPWVRIQAVWAQMKEALGQFILPFLTQMGDWFSDPANQTALQGWIEKVGEWSRSVGEDLLGKLQEFIGWLQGPEGKAAIESWMADLKVLADAIVAIADALTTVLTLFGKASAANGASKTAMGNAAKGGAFNSPTLRSGPLNMAAPLPNQNVNVTVSPGYYSSAEKVRVTRVNGGRAVM